MKLQDGARALLIEEGVATWIFGQAKYLGFFAGLKAGDLSFDMLKSIRQFVAGYEPALCPLWQWEEAILQGYRSLSIFARETSSPPSHRHGAEETLGGGDCW